MVGMGVVASLPLALGIGTGMGVVIVVIVWVAIVGGWVLLLSLSLFMVGW